MTTTTSKSVLPSHFGLWLLWLARGVWWLSVIGTGMVFVAVLCWVFPYSLPCEQIPERAAGCPTTTAWLSSLGVSILAVQVFQTLTVFMTGASWFLVGVLIFAHAGKRIELILLSLTFCVGWTSDITNINVLGVVEFNLLRADWWVWQIFGYGWFVLLIDWLKFVAMGTVAILPLVLPNGYFAFKWTRWFAVVWLVLVFPASFDSLRLMPFSYATWSAPIPELIMLIVPLAGIVALIQRWRSTDLEQRQWLREIAPPGIALAAAYLLLSYVQYFVLPKPFQGDTIERVVQAWAQNGIQVLCAVWFAFMVGFGLLRRNLFGIQTVLNRALVFSSLSALIALTFALTVYFISRALPTNDFFTIVLASVVVALLLQPIRNAVQRSVNRLLYGERDNPYLILTNLNTRLQFSSSAQETLNELTSTISKAFQLPLVAIGISTNDGYTAEATRGTALGIPIRLPVLARDEALGWLEVSPRSSTEVLSKSDLQQLKHIAGQVGMTALYWREAHQAQLARERLVTTREEERLRLRQDLHDGLGPSLASIYQRLEAANALLERSPSEARVLIAQAQARVKSSVEDVRQIVYALRPPILDQFGLVAALQENAANLGLKCQFITPHPMPGLAAAVEIAAYKIVLEALNNTAKHSNSSQCTISFTLEHLFMRLEILDFGQGLPETMRYGIGLHSMRQRCEELGGRFEIKNHARGTQISAWLPLTLQGGT